MFESMNRADKLFEEIQSLPRADRLRLAERVIREAAGGGDEGKGLRLGSAIASLGPWEGEDSEALIERLREARKAGTGEAPPSL